MDSQTAIIIGTGPSGLMAGTILVRNGWKVIFFDHNKAPARKFLVAGHGGFNLTNNESLDQFVLRYDCALIRNAVKKFTKDDFIKFLKEIGIETFVGSSGKIFPVKGIKPIQVLKCWIDFLESHGATFNYSSELIDFSEETVVTNQKGKILNSNFGVLILALGGASWKKTGSSGEWKKLLEKKGIECKPFEAGNSGIVCKNWNELKPKEGKHIKNCRIFSANNYKEGDIVITQFGLEGAPVYALNPQFRSGENVYIDFKPMLSRRQVFEKLVQSKSSSEGLRNLKLSNEVVSIFKNQLSKEEFLDRARLTEHIKSFLIPFKEFRPIDEVISTKGGVSLSELDEHFQLKKFPGIFCIGEMVDWDAPTGGYLIQGCVSSGYVSGKFILDQS